MIAPMLNWHFNPRKCHKAPQTTARTAVRSVQLQKASS